MLLDFLSRDPPARDPRPVATVVEPRGFESDAARLDLDHEGIKLDGCFGEHYPDSGNPRFLEHQRIEKRRSPEELHLDVMTAERDVVHWADGGETRLDNLVLLCRVHHARLHEEGFRLELNAWEGGRPVFYDRRGLPVPERPPLVQVGPRATEALTRANRRRGVDPGWRTAACRWERPDDVPLDVLERAYEAA